jgi:hypothetical protein
MPNVLIERFSGAAAGRMLDDTLFTSLGQPRVTFVGWRADTTIDGRGRSSDAGRVLGAIPRASSQRPLLRFHRRTGLPFASLLALLCHAEYVSFRVPHALG